MVFDNRTPTSGRGSGQSAGGRRKMWLIWLCVVAVLAGVVVGVVYLSMDPGDNTQNVGGSESIVPSGSGQTTPVTELLTGVVTEPVTGTESQPGQTQPTQPRETQAPETDPSGTQPPVTQPPATQPPTTPRPTTPVTNDPRPTSPIQEKDDITCDEFGRYTGQYVEDGRDELVENVAAVRVTNRSDQFLDFATITMDISGRTATFVVTGLPAGRSAWVLEASRMTIGRTEDFELLDCVTSFRSGVTAQTDRVKITANGNMLTATNNTSQTLENVFVYYRTLHTDGYFLGGITYAVGFGTLEPGQSMEVLAGHYDSDTSEIVRIGWTNE